VQPSTPAECPKPDPSVYEDEPNQEHVTAQNATTYGENPPEPAKIATQSDEQPPKRPRGRPKKVDAPAADSGPKNGPQPTGDKPISNLKGDESLLIPPKQRAKQLLNGDTAQLAKISEKVLGYDRQSFEDLFEREAVAIVSYVLENQK
jgi:hypothetical protein